MNRRRRRRAAGAKRPESTTSYVIAGISLVSAIAYFLFISSSISTKGNTANVMGGLGVLFLLAGIGCFVVGYRQVKDVNFSLRSRLVGVIAPGIVTLMWLYMYLVGLLYG